jgi:serine/threonine protein kinase
VVHLIGGSIRPGNYFLVSRFYSRGALDVLLKNAAVELPAERLFRFALQVARAMKYLHALNVMHRDLKPANVLVDADWTAAVCDFGVSRCVDSTASLNMTRGVGTPLYIAPEVLEGTVYDTSADVFSFGICLWQTLEREEPYKGVNYMQLVPLIVQENLRPKISDRSERFRPLLEACWNADPAARPNFEQVVVQLKQLNATAAAASAEPPARVMRMVSLASATVELAGRSVRSPRGGSNKDRGAALRKSTNEIEFK